MGLIGVRLAPGVRVSVTKRGMRAHVGPRALRVHGGAGRTGLSTGAGPLTYYTAVGSTPRRGTRTPASGPTPAQAEKAARAAELEEQLQELARRHHHTFTPMTRPLAQVAEVDAGATLQRHLRAARAGVPWYDVAARRHAKRAARERAELDDREEHARRERERKDRQEELDAFWRRLTSNHPATVMAFLQEALDDNEEPSVVVGVSDDEAYLVVVAPEEAVVPDQVPGVTPTGKPSLRKMPAKLAAAYHRQAIAGTLLLTAMEAFAVAPGLGSVKIAALRSDESPSLLWNVRIRRSRLDGCVAAHDTSLEVLGCAADENDIRLVGAAGRLGELEPAACGWSGLNELLMHDPGEDL